MAFPTRTKKKIVIALLAIALIPIIFATYQVFFSGNTSVNFLGNTHPSLITLLVCYYAFLLCLGIYWLTKQLIRIANLQTEKTKAELMLLKSQVSPHFFFNMLNNLYGLVIKDATKAQQLILKLSDLMRYSIYEGEKETIELQQEIDFLKNYIELHKMRYHKNISVTFNYSVNKKQKIVPLLFIILLENAFKHGVENLLESAYIKIDLTGTQNSLIFVVENNYKEQESEPGVGLKNLKRRLELIYPKQHTLLIEKSKTVYRTQLTINNYDKVFNY